MYLVHIQSHYHYHSAPFSHLRLCHHLHLFHPQLICTKLTKITSTRSLILINACSEKKNTYTISSSFLDWYLVQIASTNKNVLSSNTRLGVRLSGLRMSCTNHSLVDSLWWFSFWIKNLKHIHMYIGSDMFSPSRVQLNLCT